MESIKQISDGEMKGCYKIVMSGFGVGESLGCRIDIKKVFKKESVIDDSNSYP